MRADAIGLFWQDLAKVKIPKPPKPKIQPPARTWESPTYLPYLEDARALKGVQLMSDDELFACAFNGDRLYYDVEVYWNYFCVCFRSQKTKKVVYFEMDEHKQLDIQKFGWIMQNCLVIGFNNLKYDDCMVQLALTGATNTMLKAATNDIILGVIEDGQRKEVRSWQILKRHNVERFDINQIDLIEVAPLRGSLKAYAGRGHVKRMQDLPFHPENILTEDQKQITLYYCMNDLDSTSVVNDHLLDQIAIREVMTAQYGVDLRSKSDAQIAEAVLSKAIYKATGQRPQKPTIAVGTTYRYDIPAEIGFQTQGLQDLLEMVRNTDFIVSRKGSIEMPKELAALNIKIGKAIYKMGIGGLHSKEKSVGYIEDKDHVISDFDVESYYPKIILNQELYPPHLGRAFLTEYAKIVASRIAAKEAKNASDTETLKIVINGSYGKLGSKHSILYAPKLLIQVTITGQLCLLMLAEAFELSGIQVISGNTDGITVRCPRHLIDTMKAITTWWQQRLNFKLEETKYIGLFNRDVNNYVAVKARDKEGKIEVKGKGVFANPWSSKKNMAMRLHKNPQHTVCYEAITTFLSSSKPIHQSILDCKDITKFVCIQFVAGGGVKDGEFLGKNVRWYYSTQVEGTIIYASTGKKVSMTEGARPCMDTPEEFPADLDYHWYIRKAEEILKKIGYVL